MDFTGRRTDILDLKDRYTQISLALLLGVLALRVLGVMITPLNLGPDEAQYWRWSQSLDWGYFSKPPLIAWVISASTYLFGESEWAIRLPAPFLHFGTSLLLFGLAKAQFTPRIAAYSAVTYILMPGVTLSSGVMTTDSLLLFFWSAALFVLWRWRTRPQSLGLALLLGSLIGLGFLAKYAMIYFLIGVILVCLYDPPTRRAVLSWRAGLGALLAGLILSPHIYWNITHSFQTLSHTIDNAHWTRQVLNLDHALVFFSDQMGIAGPIAICLLIAALIGVLYKAKQRQSSLTISSSTQTDALIWLSSFVIPALTIILVQAMISRAHANWAATAYCAGSLMIAAYALQARAWPVWIWYAFAGLGAFAALIIANLNLTTRLALAALPGCALLMLGWSHNWRPLALAHANFAVNAVIGGVFMVLAVGPAAWSDGAGFGQSFKRTRGWPETVDALSKAVSEHQAAALIVDEREHWHGLDYYGRAGKLGAPVYTWPRYDQAQSFAETISLPPDYSGIVLIASAKPYLRPRIRADFKTIKAVGSVNIQLYETGRRQFKLYVAEDYQPLARTPDWEARFKDQKED